MKERLRDRQVKWEGQADSGKGWRVGRGDALKILSDILPELRKK